MVPEKKEHTNLHTARGWRLEFELNRAESDVETLAEWRNRAWLFANEVRALRLRLDAQQVLVKDFDLVADQLRGEKGVVELYKYRNRLANEELTKWKERCLAAERSVCNRFVTLIRKWCGL